MEYLLGLDIGTTHLKGGAFTTDGKVAALKLVKTPVIDLGRGRAVYDPDTLWSSIRSLIRQVLAELGPNGKILSIAAASMGEAGLLIDDQGKPLTPILAWHDTRGEEVVDEWITEFGSRQTFAITGLEPGYIFSLMKLLWYKRHQPQILSKAHKWLCMMDYIIYKLSGEFATEYSVASRTMLFDIHRKNWSEEIVDFAGLDIGLLPDAHPGGKIVGYTTKAASAATGVPVGVPVCTGGHDHICGAFAVGAFGPGHGLDSLGTAESLVMAYDTMAALDMENVRSRGYSLGCHVVGGGQYLLGAVNASGLSVEWFKDEFCFQEFVIAEKQGKSIYDVLIEEANKSPIGAGGLIYVPQLRGAGPPNPDPRSRGAFLGLRDYHSRGDCLRAVFEGMAMQFGLVLTEAETALKLEIPKLQASGGGTKNRILMEIKTAVLNRPIEVPAVQESTLFGAALLGGLGIGVYRNEHDAWKRTYKVSQVYEPNQQLSNAYENVREVYAKVLPLIQKASKIIAE